MGWVLFATAVRSIFLYTLASDSVPRKSTRQTRRATSRQRLWAAPPFCLRGQPRHTNNAPWQCPRLAARLRAFLPHRPQSGWRRRSKLSPTMSWRWHSTASVAAGARAVTASAVPAHRRLVCSLPFHPSTRYLRKYNTVYPIVTTRQPTPDTASHTTPHSDPRS